MKPDKEREGRERMRSEMKGNIGERKLCTLCRGWNRRQNHTVGFIGVSVCAAGVRQMTTVRYGAAML